MCRQDPFGNMRFIVTGSGRCGTDYMSRLLAYAAIPCEHEKVYNIHTGLDPDWQHYRAVASCMAVPYLHLQEYPVVLLTRHPLRVAQSWLEIGMFTDFEANNPAHKVFEAFAPEIYAQPTEQDKALAQWFTFNWEAMPYAELRYRIEEFGPSELHRLLHWAGANTSRVFAHEAIHMIDPLANHHPGEDVRIRGRVGREGTVVTWNNFRNQELVNEAKDLAERMGYDV